MCSGHPVLRNISLMMALVNFVGSTVYAQLVLFAKDRLLASDSQVGAAVFGRAAWAWCCCRWRRGRCASAGRSARSRSGALVLEGLLTSCAGADALVLGRAADLDACAGLGMLFNINTGSLRQAIVPNHLLGRVISIAGVLAWSAIPLGTLLGGLAIAWTGNVALVYAVIGVLTVIIPLLFALTPLGHAERYMPGAEAGSVGD